MIKRSYYRLLLYPIIAITTGCFQVEQPIDLGLGFPHSLSVDSKELTFNSGTDTSIIYLNTSDDFTVTSDVSWISFGQSQKIDTQKNDDKTTKYTQEIIVEVNRSNADRQGFISISTNYNKTRLQIRQLSYSLLKAVAGKYTIGDKPSELLIQLVDTIDVSATTSADWITVKRTNSTNVIVGIRENELPKTREGFVYLSTGPKEGNQKDTVKIIQSRKNAIILSPQEKDIDWKGGSFGVTVTSNVQADYTVQAPWITVADGKGLPKADYYFKVSENKSRFDRRTGIIFSNWRYNLIDSVTVHQEGIESKLLIKYSGTDFSGLTLTGDAYGIIQWGDGTDEELDVSKAGTHHYQNKNKKTITVTSHNSTGFELESIVGVDEIDLSKF